MFVLLTAITSACVDPYYPELGKYENTLAVDGMVTSGPGPYYVKLQTAATVYYPVMKPLSNAEVYVADDLGNIEHFEETEPGVYTNASPGFQGIVGRSYRLTVTLTENNVYQSSWEKLSAPLGIDSVYAELENHIDPNFPYNLSGYQFYIDTKQATSDTTFLLWRLTSTYKYNSDYKCRFMYIGSIVPFPNPDSLFTCWKTETVPEIIVGTTKSSKNNELIRYPLHYVSGEERYLSIRYSVLVNQYVVSETVYDYWNAVRGQNEIQGTLYTQQPYQIRGNMVNINNTNEPVMGCFAAAGIEEKRVFYNSPNIDYHYEICILHEADYENMKNLFGSSPSSWPIYLGMDVNYYKFNPEQRCIDCREKGGKLEKPDFWVDN